MRPIFITKSLTALDRDGICAAQQKAGAGDLTINGALASGGVATMDTQRIVGIYSAADLSARTFTVYGTDDSGASINETITGPNATTVSSVLNYYTVTRVAVDGAVGSDVEVGTTGVGASRPVGLDQHISPFAIGLFLQISGTTNVTVQYTASDIFSMNALTATGLDWTDHANLTGKTADADSNVAYPCSAVRLVINSGTGTTTFIVRQAGLGG